MPTYDYECQACGHRFERFHAPDEKQSRTCPICRKRRVERQIGGGAGVIFKGSGFYETDYRRKAPTKPATEAPKPAGDSGTPVSIAGDARSSDSKSGDSQRSGAAGKTGS